MADGGEEFGDEKTTILKNTDDQDDDEQMADRTKPFQPSSSSTPQNGREQMVMKTMHHEKSGFPPSWDETSFSGRDASVEEIEKRLYILTDGRTGILDINKADKNGILLTQEEQRSQLAEARKYLKANYPEGKPENLDLGFYGKRRNQIMVRGPGGGLRKVFLDNGSGLTQDFLNAKYVQKILGEPAEVIIEKKYRKKQKRSKGGYQLIPEEEEEIVSTEKAYYQTKSLEEMNEQESKMQRKIEKNDEVIQDDKAAPSDKQAAQDEKDILIQQKSRLRQYIEERERTLPLSERVKEIFKKYGVTVASVILAAGVTIGVVVSTVTNALKATGKALGKGLKDIGAKLGSLLPGLIGSVASFLFKTAGQAIGFLAEHTWLLILAVVAFLFEKNIKKRR